MNKSAIQEIQQRIGTVADGAWGPKSSAACQAYLRRLMPTPHPFPAQAKVTEFYGRHGEPGGHTPPVKAIILPFLVFYEGTPVRVLRPHEKAADSLLRVFERLAEAYPTEALRHAAGILNYDGLYNPRAMRGGSNWSMHAWAIAIDLNAGSNGNTTPWPTASTMPLLVMECFAREGWMSAGGFWNRDAMHFQATQP